MDRGERGRVVVLGIARGGVVVAAEVAARLGVTCEVLVVRKLGLPGHEEVAMGALAEEGVVVADEATIRSAGVSAEAFAEVMRREHRELSRRIAIYRGGRPIESLSGATAIIVDDGIATGASARAACRAARARGSVASRRRGARSPPSSAVRELRREADDVVVLVEARGAFAVGEYYDDFDQTSRRAGDRRCWPRTRPSARSLRRRAP